MIDEAGRCDRAAGFDWLEGLARRSHTNAFFTY